MKRPTPTRARQHDGPKPTRRRQARRAHPTAARSPDPRCDPLKASLCGTEPAHPRERTRPTNPRVPHPCRCRSTPVARGRIEPPTFRFSGGRDSGSLRQPGEPDTILWRGYPLKDDFPQRLSDLPDTYRYTPHRELRRRDAAKVKTSRCSTSLTDTPIRDNQTCSPGEPPPRPWWMLRGCMDLPKYGGNV